MAPTSQTDGLRLDEAQAGLRAGGYEHEFRVLPAGRVSCTACGTASPATLFTVESQERVEGVSDPDDESLVLALACPACQARGTLTVAYGPRAGIEEAQVAADLPRPRPPATSRAGQSGAGEESSRSTGRTGRRPRPG